MQIQIQCGVKCSQDPFLSVGGMGDALEICSGAFFWGVLCRSIRFRKRLRLTKRI